MTKIASQIENDKNNQIQKILVTGSAGFIGFHTARRLLKEGYHVVGLDNINDYYDVNLKYGRLNESGIEKKGIDWGKPVKSNKFDHYTFFRLNLEDAEAINKLFASYKFDYVIHLAAQAGVRYSLDNPHTYIDSNITGFLNILEACRHHPLKHLVYASTSSVYGLNTQMPLSEKQPTQHPISLYSATKKANEMMAHTYSHLFRLPTTGLRFFTVYGPWGRPDMALSLFADAMLCDKPINVFNHGKMVRDFTYVDDIVESVKRVILQPASENHEWDGKHPETDSSSAPYRLFNIGNNNPIQLMTYIEALEKALGKEAIKNMVEIQAGDLPATHAETTTLEQYINFRPQTSIEVGVGRFVDWFLKYLKA